MHNSLTVQKPENFRNHNFGINFSSGALAWGSRGNPWQVKCKTLSFLLLLVPGMNRNLICLCVSLEWSWRKREIENVAPLERSCPLWLVLSVHSFGVALRNKKGGSQMLLKTKREEDDQVFAFFLYVFPLLFMYCFRHCAMNRHLSDLWITWNPG